MAVRAENDSEHYELDEETFDEGTFEVQGLEPTSCALPYVAKDSSEKEVNSRKSAGKTRVKTNNDFVNRRDLNIL